MQKLTMVLMLLSLLVVATGCGGQMTAWGLTAPESDLTVRLGVERENALGTGSVEAGFVAKYITSEDIPWGPQPDVIGGYMLFFLTQDITIQDTPDPSPLQALFDVLHAQPYAGGEIVGRVDGHQRKVQPNWILGTKFTLDPVSDLGICVEYLDGDEAAAQVSIGGRGRFFRF